jgi:hypothetical protein
MSSCPKYPLSSSFAHVPRHIIRLNLSKIKILIKESNCVVSCYFLSITSEYSPQGPVIKHP